MKYRISTKKLNLKELVICDSVLQLGSKQRITTLWPRVRYEKVSENTQPTRKTFFGTSTKKNNDKHQNSRFQKQNWILGGHLQSLPHWLSIICSNQVSFQMLAKKETAQELGVHRGRKFAHSSCEMVILLGVNQK